MKKEYKELTPRMQALHRFIINGNGRRFSKREIYENVDGYDWNENATDKCPEIRNDMLVINANADHDKIIIFDHQKYYWCTEEEFDEYIAKKKNTIRRCSREIYFLKKKAGKHNQMKLLSNKATPMTPRTEPYHSVFREEEK